eukprot:8003569-Alexandrium_andersonii.AAC.1
MPAVAILEDAEDDLLQRVLRAHPAQRLLEERRHVLRRVVVGPTTESTENQYVAIQLDSGLNDDLRLFAHRVLVTPVFVISVLAQRRLEDGRARDQADAKRARKKRISLGLRPPKDRHLLADQAALRRDR